MMNDEPFYYVMYRCPNCGKREELRFKKGQEAPKNAILCPNCECEKLVKVISNGS
jgi:predicted RNA-binding Zn-ribbon protein involved in translation (DUF1610 family)